MTPNASVPAKREGPWKIVLSVLVLTVMVFFFAFDVGQYYLNHSQSTYTFPIGMVLAGTWVFKTVRKTQLSGRSRAITFLIIAAIQISVTPFGFQHGKNAQYPPEQRAKVEEIQRHAREVRVLKQNLSKTRDSFSEVDQLLSIEPMVASLNEQIEQISRLDASIRHDEIPPAIAQILKLMNEALAFDKKEIENVNRQISVVKEARGLSKQETQKLYKQELLPLMEQEEEINKQREASNLQQRIVDAAKDTGSNSR